jgi:hypothetical protein
MRVQVFLKTPLFRGHYGPEREAELKKTIVELAGEALARDGGLELNVSSMHDSKGSAVEAPFTRVFLPMGKIDYYVIVEE